jgi:hypothetical protein
MGYITASCVIDYRTVYKDGQLVFEVAPGAELLTAAYGFFGFQYPKFYKMDNLSRLGWLAAEVLLKASFDPTAYRPEEVAIVLSNANSSLDTDYKYEATTKDIPSPSVFVYTLPNIVIGEICIRHGFKGENAFFLSPAFDADLVGRYAGYLLEQNIAQVCVCGWVECLGNSYKAVLFLVEKTGVREFSSENMNLIFKL